MRKRHRLQPGIEHGPAALRRPSDLFDSHFVDPAFAPGTGTPEVGGPNAYQALEVVRALAGIDIVGADLVEVSPPFDVNGLTAWLGVSLMFELLCVMVPGEADG